MTEYTIEGTNQRYSIKKPKKCQARNDLDKIESLGRTYYECIDGGRCEYKTIFENASVLTYCGKEDNVPYFICAKCEKKFFDGYFHREGLMGLCEEHDREWKKELKRRGKHEAKK